MKRHIHFARKKRQLKGLVKLLKKYTNDSIKYQEILEKTKILFNELKFRLSTQFFKKSFAGLSVGILMSLGTLKAQTFAAPVTNPFGISIPSGTFSYVDITFGDINNDGTLDIIGGSYSGNQFFSIENNGTATVPAFGAHQLSPYNLPTFQYESNPILVDIDNDGDLDILAGEYFYDYNSYYYVHGISYYENIGTNAVPDFAAPVYDPFSISARYVYMAPTMVDIDNDGDLDMIAGDVYGNIIFFENIGSVSAPNFGPAQMNPFGIDLTGGGNSYTMYSSPTLADLDNDGDLDLLVGLFNYDYYTNNSGGTFMYLENIGTNAAPIFGAAQLNPFGLTGVQYLDNITPEFVDIDGDGDFDIMMADQYGDIFFFENTTPPNSAPASQDNTVTTNEDVAYTFAVSDFAFTDIDAGDTLTSVKITALVSEGSLQLSGVDVTAGQVITAADLTNLTFAPVAGAFGVNYDSFKFSVSDGTASSAEYVMTINVDEVTGIKASIEVTALNVYPNPVVDNLKVSFENLSNETAVLEIYDLVGQLVYNNKVSNKGFNELNINASNLQSGTYILRVQVGGKQSNIKFIK